MEQDIQKVKDLGIKAISKEFARIENDAVRHDPTHVADSIIELICEDLKFKDMQNNPKYIRMNNRLKENTEKRKSKEKVKNKNKKQEEKVNNKAKRMEGRKSKFSTKYDERIKSIKTSEEKRQENIKNLEQEKR